MRMCLCTELQVCELRNGLRARPQPARGGGDTRVMGWLQNLGGLLGQYASGSGNQSEADVHQHFDQVTAAAPQSVLAQALSAAFRSDQTPPFGDLAAQVFSNSNGSQRASVLTSLLASAGPGILSK